MIAEEENHEEFIRELLKVFSKSSFGCVAVIRQHDRKIVFINDTGLKLFGYDDSRELINKYAPQLRKRVPDWEELKAFDEAMEQKGTHTEETEYVTRNGSTFWGRMQRTPFTSRGIIYQLLQIEKIDRAITAEENLSKERQRFGALLDYASIGVIIVNDQQEIVLMNPFALGLFGYEAGEVLSVNFNMLIPSRFHKAHEGHTKKYYAHPQNRPMGPGLDLYAVRKDGTEFPVEVSLGSYNAGETRFVIAFVNDITERKKREDEIRQLNTKLEAKVKKRTGQLDQTIVKLEQQVRETEEVEDALRNVMQFQKAVLDASGAMIIATDSNGLITLFNPAAEEQLGYKAVELIGNQTPRIFHIEEEVIERAHQFAEELGINVKPGFETFTIKSVLGLENKHEWEFRKKNGEMLHVSLTVTALRNEQNVITGFLGVAVDISETKKTEMELKKSLEKEMELSKLKSRFVSIASHEFRTPLSTVLSSTYLLQKYVQEEDQPKREKHIERIVASVNMLTDILNDFLSVGKIEEGRVEPKYSRFNVGENITSVINEMAPLKKPGQSVILKNSCSDLVSLDPNMLKHIVMNLLSNAIKFSPENALIQVDTFLEGNTFRLNISDEGLGIPEEDQKHLFERFFRAGNVSGIQGTGLGLHIVQRYAELMNGKIECESIPEKGTTFRLSFDLKE